MPVMTMMIDFPVLTVSWIDPLGVVFLGAWCLGVMELWSIAMAQVSRLASSLVFFRSPGRFPLLMSLPKKRVTSQWCLWSVVVVVVVVNNIEAS